MRQVKVREHDVDKYLKLLDNVGIGAGYSSRQFVKVDILSESKKEIRIARKLAKSI